MPYTTFKNRPLTPSLSIFLLLSIALAGCDQSSNVSSASLSKEPTPAERYSGQDLYKGLVFGEGKVAEKFPEIWGNVPTASEATERIAPEEIQKILEEKVTGMSDEEFQKSIKQSRKLSPTQRKALVAELQDRIIKEIKKRKPQFFEQIHASLTSGNQWKVYRTVPKMANETVVAMADVLNVSEDAVRGKKKMRLDQLGKCIDTFPAVFIGAVSVLAGFTVGAVNLFAAYNIDVAVDKAAVYDDAVWWGPEEEMSEKTNRLRNEMIVDMVTSRLSTSPSLHEAQ